MRPPFMRLLAPTGAALLACARPSVTLPPTTAPAATTGPRTAAVDATPGLTLRLAPQLNPAPRLAVHMRATGLPARHWRIAALIAADLRDLQLRDDRGPLPHTQRADGIGLAVELERNPVGPLQIDYVLSPAEPPAPLPAEVPAALTLRLDHERLLLSGELLLLPTEPDAALQLRIELTPAPPRLLRLVSSLSLAPPERVRVDALRHAAFLVGRTGSAVFRGPEGDDDFAWTGEPGFDLRWSAAETAGARSAVDLYFGATPAETARFTGLLAVDIDFPGGTGVLVLPRSGGLYVAISPGARWDARSRLAVAQGLVHRWIGGRLRLREAAEPPEAGLWFADGFARAVAREVLFDLGTLSVDDFADELNEHQAELATNPRRAANNAVVAAAAASGEPDAQALLVARGALYAARIHPALRTLLRALVEQARRDGVAELPLAAFREQLRAALGPDELATFERVIRDGAALTLPADALGDCFIRAPVTYERFDLGLDADASRAETPAHVRGLRPAGPAARAGVREGERLLDLSFVPGDPTSPVTLTLERGGKEVQLRYRPVGASARGLAWRRRPNIDEARCVR